MQAMEEDSFGLVLRSSATGVPWTHRRQLRQRRERRGGPSPATQRSLETKQWLSAIRSWQIVIAWGDQRGYHLTLQSIYFSYPLLNKGKQDTSIACLMQFIVHLERERAMESCHWCWACSGSRSYGRCVTQRGSKRGDCLPCGQTGRVERRS